MSDPSFLTHSPFLMILLKWTALLALGWMAHWLLCRRHARWRLILWRSILCFGLALPLAHFIPIHLFKIPVKVDRFAWAATKKSTDTSTAITVVSSPDGLVQSNSEGRVARDRVHFQGQHPGKDILLIIWDFGCAGGVLRLAMLHFQLSRLRKEASLAGPEFQKMAREIQDRIGVKQTVPVQISSSIASPFVCGLWKPAIMLPGTLAKNLSSGELCALMSHEIAHLRHHDLAWCMGWRWMNAVCWFHPLVWKIPAAHNLACEEEADRVASGVLKDRGSYSQLLAQLTLRVLALPAVETRLTLNGTSQIARRLNQLGQKGTGAWKWKHSLAGFSLAGVLLLLAAGWEFASITPVNSAQPPATAFKQVLVVVQDEDGKPIEGATIRIRGFRVKGPRQMNWYGVGFLSRVGVTNVSFPPNATTDHEGKGWLKYPAEALPEEKLLTGKLDLTIYHPEFATLPTTEVPVDGPGETVQLTRGAQLQVSGYFGNDHRPVIELAASVSDDDGLQKWQKRGDGVFACHDLSAGEHLLSVMGRLPSGDFVFSDTFAFTAEKGKHYNFALELKPGIRLEGRINETAQRPAKNGRVLLTVRLKEFPVPAPDGLNQLSGRYAGQGWSSYRAIAEDGTFVFESIPPGEVEVSVLGDGFASQVGGHGDKAPRFFSLLSPVTNIEVPVEPTATIEVTAKTKTGTPIVGATVIVIPEIMVRTIYSIESGFRSLPLLPKIPFKYLTDNSGMVVIQNLPASTDHLGIDHPEFELPRKVDNGVPNDDVMIKLSPGKTNKLELTLLPKGTAFIGSAR